MQHIAIILRYSTMKMTGHEEFWHLIGKLDSAIIVEGKKDKAALAAIGIPSERVLVLGGLPLFEFAQRVCDREVAILTDLDSEGKRLYGRLKALLQDRGIRINDSIRNFLFRKTKLRQIEGVNSYFREEVILHSLPSQSSPCNGRKTPCFYESEAR